MKPFNVRSLLLAGALICAATTAGVAQGYSGYWVVGNAVIHACEIVTSNPVIDYNVGSFGSGPYQSRADANLARSTIGACPKQDPGPAAYSLPELADPDESD
ncbi:MAG TPA: hypothetical protein VFQ87_12915 [Bradyrhizobium sp.]|jgi:hypothetical protein|nr:hypothetical protein [Bradyrhizobium sp.]